MHHCCCVEEEEEERKEGRGKRPSGYSLPCRSGSSKRSPSIRIGEGLERNLSSLDNLQDEFQSCSRFGSFASPTPRQQQQNVWINLGMDKK